MLGALRVAVVIPAFDEARLIAWTIASVPAFVDLVIVVDDASKDATARSAREAGDERTIVIEHATNRGVGAAIVTGYRRARDEGCDVAVVMAGDGQMDPKDLARLIGPIARGEADYVKGDRSKHPEALRTMPIARLVASQALAFVTKIAAGLDALSDSQCGFAAISARAIDALDLDALWPRYGYPNDLIGALALRGFKIAEVVVRPVYLDETSGLRAKHLATIAWLCARVAARRAWYAVTDASARGAALHRRD